MTKNVFIGIVCDDNQRCTDEEINTLKEKFGSDLAIHHKKKKYTNPQGQAVSGSQPSDIDPSLLQDSAHYSRLL